MPTRMSPLDRAGRAGQRREYAGKPASLSLRFGTVYDKRNLPSLTVNQFEQADPKKFPWAIRMPVAGLAQPELEQR